MSTETEELLREAIEAAEALRISDRGTVVSVTPEAAIRAAYPIIRRRVALEIAEAIRATRGSAPLLQPLGTADWIEREFGVGCERTHA